MKNKFCINHPEKPAKTRRLCANCYSKYLYESNPEYKERQRKNAKKFYDLNKEYFYNYNRSKRLGNPDKYKKEQRKWRLKRDYGLTEDKISEMISNQNNSCAICGTEDFGKKGPNVDHCHATNKVRGILCGRCNKAIGLFSDDISIMENAISYIKNNKN